MAPSSNPLFARLNTKLARAREEFDNLTRSLAREDALYPGEPDVWGRTTKIAAAVHNIYNGLEDVMSDVARQVDGAVPSGDSSHQDLLDQMSAPIDGVRPAFLDKECFDGMVDLKSFRHLVRHKYGYNVDLDKSEEKYRAAGTLLESFDKAVVALHDALQADDEDEPTPQPR